MRIYEVFVLLANGVTARGCVPGTSYANVRAAVLAQLNRRDVVSVEIHQV